MCQPGRPGPQGLSHDGSPGFELFQSAKSPGLRFSDEVSIRAGHQLFGIAVAQLAIIRSPGDVEVDVSARLIGKSLVDQALVHRDDLGDVLGGPRHRIDAIDPQGGEASKVVFGHLLGQLAHRRSSVLCGDDQLVVDVGDVHHPRHIESEVAEVVLDRIEDDRPDHVADVALRVNRRPADIHSHLAGNHRLERLLGLAQGVVNSQWHGARSCSWG